MTVTLEPMSAERFVPWTEQQIRDYAQEKIDAGIWAEEDAGNLWLFTNPATRVRETFTLYESAGFVPTNMNMMKRIAPA